MVDNRSGKGSEEEKDRNEVKSCVDCGTTKTPLWRSGPAGPKSLCNACGIKSRKRRGSAVSSVNKSSTEEKKAKKLSTNTQDITSSNTSNNNKQSNKIRNSSNGNNKESNISRNNSDDSSNLSQPLQKKLVPLGQEVVFQRSIAERLRRRQKMESQEEQAAMLLMALSCGSCVY